MALKLSQFRILGINKITQNREFRTPPPAGLQTPPSSGVATQVASGAYAPPVSKLHNIFGM